MSHALALRQAGWRHPEAGAAALVAVAWLVLLAPVLGGDAVRAAHDDAHAAAPVLAAGAGWLLMAGAMMLPGSLPIARFLATTGLWARRRRTVALFLGSYLLVWAAFGAIVLPVVALAGDDVAAALLPGLLVAAAAWELTRRKWRAARACRLVVPLPPRGRRADAACAGAGVRHGGRCVVACGPVMLAMAVAGHGAVGLMLVATGLVTVEKLAPERDRLARPAAALLALTAVAVLAAQGTPWT